jgi:hypothetical protein
MYDDGVLHTWFIFNLHTEVSFIFTGYVTQFLQTYINSQRKRNPCYNKITLYYLFGEPASLLVVTNPRPPLSLVC